MRTLAALVVAVAVLGACGDDDDPEDLNPTKESVPTDAPAGVSQVVIDRIVATDDCDELTVEHLLVEEDPGSEERTFYVGLIEERREKLDCE